MISEVNIGSNVFINTTGVLAVQGKDQISLEWGDENDQLLLTMDVYDDKGKHVAKLRRNAWAFNDKNRFNITTYPGSLKLQDKQTDALLVEARVVGAGKIEIPHGRFYTHKGHLLEITPTYWRIAGGMTMSRNRFENVGKGIAIG